ncbi:MAG: homocysteine S-methyltransferase family protein [Blastomonas sp.]
MSRLDRFMADAASRILITDGAFGTEIQRYRLSEADFAGALGLARDQKGNNDILSLTRPDVVGEIGEAYLKAGADIVSTNTFSSNRISQADYAAEHLVREINLAAARIARECADRMEQAEGRTCYVAGAIGPTNKTLSLSPDVNDPGYREIEFDELCEVYREQCDALVEGGVDFLLVETIFDTLNAKAAIIAAKSAALAAGREVPIMLSMTITDNAGRNLAGHCVEAFWATVRHARPIAVGLNCSFGADRLRPSLAALSRIADTLVLAYPNAGLPNDLGEYDETPDETAGQIDHWFEQGLVNIVGGCCGTTPAHIAMLAERARSVAPRAIPQPLGQTLLSGLDPMTLAA